jgi:hypothetical protein
MIDPAIAAIGFCVLIAALGLFQLALIAGVPLGHFAWGGQHRILSPRLRAGSAASIAIYAAFALVIADCANLVAVLPDQVARIGAWGIVAYLGLGVSVNAISRSVPERLVMTPVALVLGVLALVVALAGGVTPA